MIANVLNGVIPCECKDIFIHNKIKRNCNTLSPYLITVILFLNTRLFHCKIVVREQRK